MTLPQSPAGYTDWEGYELPSWSVYGALIVMTAIAIGILHSLGVGLFQGSKLELLASATISISATLFLHESLHYIADLKLGYDPEYVWPNSVAVTNELLPTWDAVLMLLAPQLLTLIYIGILSIGVSPSLEVILGWGLVLNTGGAGKDLPWVVRRLTWPDGTLTVATPDFENYVAFPEEA